MNNDYILAGKSTLSDDDLDRLAQSEFWKVRRRLAENPEAPELLLVKLAGDSEPEVRIAVAQSGRASISLLRKLVADEHVDVRLALAADPLIPRRFLYRLSKDENPYVSDLAQKTLYKLDFAGHKSDAVPISKKLARKLVKRIQECVHSVSNVNELVNIPVTRTQ